MAKTTRETSADQQGLFWDIFYWCDQGGYYFLVVPWLSDHLEKF